jgi:hypothetical protein
MRRTKNDLPRLHPRGRVPVDTADCRKKKASAWTRRDPNRSYQPGYRQIAKATPSPGELHHRSSTITSEYSTGRAPTTWLTRATAACYKRTQKFIYDFVSLWAMGPAREAIENRSRTAAMLTAPT